MVNLGAIMSASLIRTEETENARFAYIFNFWKSMLGECRTADDNYSAAFRIMEFFRKRI